MSTSREHPQTQDANKIFNAETRPKLVVKDELGGRSDKGEVGGAGSGTSFDVLFVNLVLELWETIGVLLLMCQHIFMCLDTLPGAGIMGAGYAAQKCAGFCLSMATQTPKTILSLRAASNNHHGNDFISGSGCDTGS